MACDFGCVISWTFFCFKIVSVPLYVSVLYVLIKKRKQLNSSFFRICISLGFADLGYLAAKFLFKSVPAFLSWTSLAESKSFATLSHMLTHWGFYHCQVFGVVLLSFNRLSTIWWLDKSERVAKFWTQRSLTLAIGFQWFWMVPFAFPQLFECCHSVVVDNQTFDTMFGNPQEANFLWTLDIVLESLFLAPLLIMMHILMFLKAVQHKGSVAPANLEPLGNIFLEMRYATIGFFLCGTYVYLRINWTLVWLNGGFLGHSHPALIEAGRTVFSTINPFLLIAYGDKFRLVYLDFLFGRSGYMRKSLYKTSSSEGSSPINIEFHRMSRILAARGATPGEPDRPIYLRENSSSMA